MDDETRRVVELEDEIAQTRVELGGTIEAIQDRLAPSTIAATAADRVRQSAVVEKIRANVLPITAVGAGVGAAWLASRLDGRRRQDTWDPCEM
jgi:hypothetical protein